MKARKTLTYVALVGVMVTVGVSQAHAQDSTAIAEGSRVYGNTCGSCHNARSPLERTDRQWVTIVNHMRVRGNLTGRQARAVLAFLQASNGDPGATSGGAVQSDTAMTFSNLVSSDPTLVERGGQLMALKACIGCHIAAGAGGNVGPALDDVVGNKGPSFVRAKLADPTFNNSTSMMPNFGLTPEEIDALVAYLGSLTSDGGQD